MQSFCMLSILSYPIYICKRVYCWFWIGCRRNWNNYSLTEAVVASTVSYNLRKLWDSIIIIKTILMVSRLPWVIKEVYQWEILLKIVQRSWLYPFWISQVSKLFCALFSWICIQCYCSHFTEEETANKEIELHGRSVTTYYWFRKDPDPNIPLTSLKICYWNIMCVC